MPRLRVMLLGLALIALAFWGGTRSHFAFAQVNVPGNNPNGISSSTGGLLLVDRSLVKRLKNAEQLIDNNNVDGAVAPIQSILDLPQDGFYRPENEPTGRLISLKQHAESILDRATPEMRQAYERQVGTEARRLFLRAAEQRNPAIAEEVMRRFLHTAAGADAVYWLGSFHQDRADYDSAVQCFLRLGRLAAASQFEPQLTLRTGVCLYRTGRVDKAVGLIRTIAATSKTPLKLAGQQLPSDGGDPQILAWLKATSPSIDPVSEPTGWLMSRGNAERNLLFRSSPPLGKSLWHTSLVEWQIPADLASSEESKLDLKAQMGALASIHADKGSSPLPCGTPLLVNDVVVVRFLDHLAGFDLRTGQELWRSAENDRIFHLLEKHRGDKEPTIVNFSIRIKSSLEMFNLMLRQRTWEDLTFGTLSSDGDLVFSVEDLGFLNDIHIPAGMVAGGAPVNHPLVMRDYNRLCAYEAKTGKLKWELGGPRGQIALPQAGTFFLGPPLAVDRRLMCLVESQGLVQLLVLDSRTGKTMWTQVLSQPLENLMIEPSRRRAGLTPVLLGDLLVCPTGSGLVVTIDMASRSHAWAYQYTSPQSTSTDPRMLRLQMAMRGAPRVDMDLFRGAEINEWQDGGPIIADGHVLLTPRDSAELHCLSLEDGRVAWRVPRKDGLYVAAVQSGLVIVVSSRSVEALRLTDGKLAWPLPVPLLNQAGRGIVTEGQILLPLVTGEVASINLKSGQLLSRSKIHEPSFLGNLIPGQGFIVSQSATNLAVFRTLDSIAAETAARLKQNPNDPDALASRGEFRLSQGDAAGGQADLRQSLKLRKSSDTQDVLFESLLQALQADFAGHRSTLAELEQLADAPAERVALYRAWSEGLLSAKQFTQAFAILLKLSDADLGKPTLDRLDGYRSMRRDHWVRTQMQHLLQSVDEPIRAQIDAEIRERLKSALAKQDPEDLRNVIRHFGSHPLADEVRLALAEQLTSREYTIEAEQLLSQLSSGTNPKIAGHALALMIRETIKSDHSEECAFLLERLAKEFASVVCLDNKTGGQLAEEWSPKVNSLVPFAVDWPTGRIEASRETAPARIPKYTFDVGIDGDAGPFFKHSQFVAMQEQDGTRVVGMNGWGKVQWAIPGKEAGTTENVLAYRAQVRNHIVLLTMGRRVCAVNTLMSDGGSRAHALWHSPLVEGVAGEDNQFLPVPVQRAGMVRPQFNRIDFQQNPLGTVGAIEDDSVVIQRGRHLILADLLTGDPLWKRTDLTPGSEIFGDSEVIVVVPPDKAECQIIRRLDGVTIRDGVAVPALPFRILTHKQKLLSYSRNGQSKVLRLQLDDVPQQQQLWNREFELLSQLAVVSRDEIAVLQPGAGTLSLIRVTDGTVLWEEKITLAANRKELWIIPNGDRLLVMNGEIPAGRLPRPVMIVGQSNQIIIDAQAECLDRATGKSYWKHKVEGLALDYTLPQYLPCWLFTIVSQTIQPPNLTKSEFQMLAIDKRSGQVILKSKEEIQINKFLASIDQAEKTVRVSLYGGNETPVHKFRYTNEPIESPVPAPANP